MKKTSNYREIYKGNIYVISKKQVFANDDKQVFDNSVRLLKEDAYLLKVCEHGYIDIENITSYLKFKNIKNYIYSDDSFNIGDFIYTDKYSPNSDVKIYVDPKSLKLYNSMDFSDGVSYEDIENLRKLK